MGDPPVLLDSRASLELRSYLALLGVCFRILRRHRFRLQPSTSMSRSLLVSTSPPTTLALLSAIVFLVPYGLRYCRQLSKTVLQASVTRLLLPRHMPIHSASLQSIP